MFYARGLSTRKRFENKSHRTVTGGASSTGCVRGTVVVHTPVDEISGRRDATLSA